MRYVMFGLASAILLLLVYVGNTHGVGQERLPALGHFLSPTHGFWQQAVPSDEDKHINLELAGRSGQVKLDERGVPHIFAATLEDALFLQGYMHAQDRLFQMDISVRATGGRLAEVLGDRLLERDQTQRRKGLRVAAQRTADSWNRNPEAATALAAYVAGVNTYIEALDPKDYPVEYKLMGFAPEPWSVFKSAMFSKSMAESLCFRHYDLPTTNARSLLGDSLFQHLYPEWNPKQSPIVPTMDHLVRASEEEADFLSGVYDFPALEQAPEGIGSNNWALAGSKTSSGAPLLANDPHLSLTLPSIWYEVQLNTAERNVYGVSLPGLPGILIGFNEQIAWGITNVGQDVADWYRIEWIDDQQEEYLLDGKPTAPEWVTDTILVRGQSEPTIIRTPWTIFGPVVYDQEAENYYNLALRWAAQDPPFHPESDNMEAFLDLGASTGLAGYTAALSAFDNPGSNVVYANQAGDIAITVTGHFPLRRQQQGRFIQDGSKSENQWSGFIPYDEVPR
ncbi:MAG: penicillin acylase family protein, partial [Bacteroidota bacterium]